jgi:hypothetical protein
MGRTTKATATAVDDAIPMPSGNASHSDGNGSATRGQALSSLDKDERNGVYLMAGDHLNEALTALSQAFPDVLISELAAVLSVKANEKNFSVSINPLLRALCEYLNQDPDVFLNEVAPICNVPRRYLGVQRLSDGGYIFKLNNILTSADTITNFAVSLRKEFSTVMAEPGFQDVRDRQRAQGQERANRKQQEIVY